MSRSISSDGRTTRPGVWGSVVVLVAGLSLSGCSMFSQPELDFSHADGLRDTIGLSEPLRPADNEMHPFAVTNKGMAIERSLGVQ